MLDVRAGIDQIDREILTLIGERFRFMEAAARIKPGRDKIRDDGRKAEVLGNVAGHAAANGVPAEVAAELYERLIEASIAYELERYDDRASAAATD
ncbi:chorismate mutase [Sphingosinicella terrae]|uniref:chorismate mutase n=1 Tax=Sphingosinicella terrae TaxID=2172047 RepID=UPI002546F2BB|nr:chorismate mutase [Sphingosinicella terrae]